MTELMSGYQTLEAVRRLYSRTGAFMIPSAHDHESARKKRRRWVSDKYHWDRVAARTMAAYQAVLDGRPIAS